MTAPAVRSFHVFNKQMTLTWYLPVIFMFFAKTLFFISTANQFNSPYMRYKHILSVSRKQTLALARSAGPPSPPPMQVYIHLHGLPDPPSPPFHASELARARKKSATIVY